MAAENLTSTNQKTISIKRTFNLPLSTVWKAWSEPESFKKWWGPKEFTCPDCTIDFKVGGKLVASMQGQDGKKIWSTGTYKEIIPQQKIIVTDSFADSSGNIVSSATYNMPEMPLELLVTIELKEVDGKTNLLLKHEGLPVEMADDCEKGWQSSFDKMENNLK